MGLVRNVVGVYFVISRERETALLVDYKYVPTSTVRRTKVSWYQNTRYGSIRSARAN